MSQKLAKQQVEDQYKLHAAGLRRFLLGVLRDPDLAEEVLQQTFVQLMEKGHEADAETMKGGIYKVAFHQAIARRKYDSLVQERRSRANCASAEHATEVVREIVQNCIGRHRQVG